MTDPKEIAEVIDDESSEGIVSLPISPMVSTRPSPHASSKDSFPTGEREDDFIWNEDEPPGVNYSKLGQRLSQVGDLFRRPQYGDGLALLLPDKKTASICRGADLSPVIVDRIRVQVFKDGKLKGGQIAAAHLNAMLKSDCFLDHVQAVDQVVAEPVYLPDFCLTVPGFNDGGDGNRVLFIGKDAEQSASTDFIDAFLDEMAFASNSDRTNAAAGLITVLLRNHWPGGKPIMVVTATKSHAGKDTVISFTAGTTKQCSVSYQSTNWALERSFVGVVNHNPEIGLVVVENARLDRRDKFIASAFIERFATDPEPMLFSTGTGQPTRRTNDIVLAISTNHGCVSEDIMNRALPIHLNPVGNVADRTSSIGNPKLEFLPTHREEIAAEARGMVERWKEAGQPLDSKVRHPFSTWATTVGGILQVNGYTDFLANYGQRKTADDPLREALGILGASMPDQWQRPERWAHEIAKLGLNKRVIPPGDQDSDAGRRRGAGVVLSAHRDETFITKNDESDLTLRLERKRSRFGEAQVHVRYRFAITEARRFDEPGSSPEESHSQVDNESK